MQDNYREAFILIVSGSIIALLLVGFIVTILILYKNRQHSHEQELLKSRIEIQENTFTNISQEIHDNIGQVLSVIKITLASAPIEKEHIAYEYVQDSKQMISGVIEDVSDLSKSLHPERISKLGIAEAIRFELRKLQKTGIFETSFDQPVTQITVSTNNEIILFRIIQEILNNIVKHSKAKKIGVLIREVSNGMDILIEDNGTGFELEKAVQKNTAEKGIGLTSMISRTKLIGGTLDINTQPGMGTRIVIHLPSEILTKRK